MPATFLFFSESVYQVSVTYPEEIYNRSYRARGLRPPPRRKIQKQTVNDDDTFINAPAGHDTAHKIIICYPPPRAPAAGTCPLKGGGSLAGSATPASSLPLHPRYNISRLQANVSQCAWYTWYVWYYQ